MNRMERRIFDLETEIALRKAAVDYRIATSIKVDREFGELRREHIKLQEQNRSLNTVIDAKNREISRFQKILSEANIKTRDSWYFEHDQVDIVNDELRKLREECDHQSRVIEELSEELAKSRRDYERLNKQYKELDDHSLRMTSRYARLPKK